jgi:zinc transporter 7
MFLPKYAAGESSPLLSLGQAMAAGGLLGDVFLHTLSDDVDGLWVLGGFTLFLMADMLIRAIQRDQSCHFHSHSLKVVANNNNSHENIHAKENRDRKHNNSKPVHLNRSMILLSLAADALHNFTDGLAIGASYSMDKSSSSLDVWTTFTSHPRGSLASISIALHEIPHELGDFCSLIRSGYSSRQAILAQFMTAVAAFCGTATACALSHDAWTEERLLWITAGGFVYLACTTILPEVISDHGCSIPFRFAQLASFCVGIAFLYVVAILEVANECSPNDENCHVHHHHGHHHHLAKHILHDHDHHTPRTEL